MIKLIEVRKEGIIEGINISIPDNSKVALIGNNGTGKTTLLYLLSGIYLSDSGMITVSGNHFNFPIQLNKYNGFLKFIRNNLFFIENTNIFYEKFTIEQNLKYSMSLDCYDENNIWKLFSLFSVNENLDKPFKDISKGTKQKLIVLLALSSKKNYILLDEPTLGLDNDSKNLFYDLIRKLNKTIIISTHDIEQLSDFDLVYECESKHLNEVKKYALN